MDLSFGFLLNDNDGPDIYIPSGEIQNSDFLLAGDLVECEVEENRKGLIARHIKKIEEV